MEFFSNLFNKEKNEKILASNNGKLLEIDNQTIDCVCIYIDHLFPLNNLLSLKTEKNVLEYYYQKEKECLQYIDNNFFENEDLYSFFVNFAKNIIKEKYESNKDILNIKAKIDSGEAKIIEKFRKNENLNADKLEGEYIKIFNTKKIPKFIEKRLIEDIHSIQLINKLNNNAFIEKKENIEEDLIDYYNQFRKGVSRPFGFNDNKVLFNILLYSNLKDIYKNEKIKNIFIDNYLQISEIINHFDKDFQNLILIKKNHSYIHNKLIECFDEYEINDLHIYIIASYFYLIMDKMKDSNNIKLNKINVGNNINLNNPLFNKILKNVLYNFSIYCPNDKYTFKKYRNIINFFNSFLIVKGKGEKENKRYNLDYIENIIKNSKLFKVYKDFKDLSKKLIEIEESNTILDEIIDSLIDQFDYSKVELIPLSKRRNSNTISILISGFLSEGEDINSWETFYNYDRFNSNYYLFRWPSSELFDLFNITHKYFMKAQKLFLNCQKKAKLAGKILALFLACNVEFNNCQINLVGFSLGCQVIKYCIKQLDKIEGHRDMINNVLFMGGATVINEQKKNKWRNIFEKTVGGRVINCYSTHDYVLKFLFTNCTNKNPIGINKINLKDKDGEYDIIEDYDFSYLKLGHIEYRDNFDEIFNKVNFLN